MPATAARGSARGGPLTAPTGEAYRCAVAGEERGEELAGTASTFRAFLLLEHAGSWGVDALRDSRLPSGVGPALKAACATAGVKPLLMRRPGRSSPQGCRVFAVFAGDGERPAFVETAVLERPDDAIDLDVAALRAGSSVGLPRHDEPVFGVCTHGRHDTCCAVRGRPVAAALAAAYPEHAWEFSHLGGDRFAANLLVLPDGLYFGRLDASSALAVVGARMRGEIELEHLRGRSSLPAAVQYAETALRLELGERRLDAVRVLGRFVDGPDTTVRLGVGPAAYDVVVRTAPGSPVLLTCRAREPEPPPVHRVVSLAPVGRPAAG